MKTWMFALGFAIVGTGTAAAQEPDDFSFAKKLAYRGWFDAAADVCTRIEKDPSLPREVRSALPLLLAEIELAKADREPDAEKSMKFIDASIAILRKFIGEEDSHPRIYEAYINIGFLKSRKAKMLVDQLDSAKLPADHDRLRKDATSLYKEVATEFDERVARWKGLPGSSDPNGPISGAIMDARLEAERARYEFSRIPGVDANDRKKFLEEAVKNLLDYEMDYGNTAKGFEAMLLEARCLFEQAEYTQAEVKLKSTMVLRDVLEEHRISRNPYFDQIIFGAYLTLAQVYLKANKPKEAQEFIEDIFKTDPTVGREWIGNALKVEKVDALFKRKKDRDAQKLAQEVIAADTDGPFGRLMRNKLRELGSTFSVDPATAILAGQSSMERGRFREAMGTLRQAVENCVTDAQKAKDLPQALYLMGQSLQEMKRNYEAAMTFERVYQVAPANKELAPLALWQAVICFTEEFDTFADPADEREKNRLMSLLTERFKDHPVTDSIYYLQGMTLERQRKLLEAAEKYKQVPERATAYERALVRAGYSLRADAFKQYSKLARKDATAEQAILDQLKAAEALFMKFLKRTETVQVEGELARDRAQLLIAVNQELAYLYNHKLVGKAKEALVFLDKVAKDIPADDERMAKIHLLQIQSHLVLNQDEQAVQIMEVMFDRFQHLQETAQACKSVAIRLDEITTAKIKDLKGKELDDATKENLKKISRYYKKWMDGAMTFGLDARVTDVISVANTLYLAAMRLNGLDPNETRSFIDLRKNQIVTWKNYFGDAEFILTLLVSERFKGKYPDKERIFLSGLRARCLSFNADSPEGWGRAKTAYEDLIKEFKVINDKGDFVANVLVQNPFLVALYIELGYVYFELGRTHKIHYDNSITTFVNVGSVSASGGEPWWHSRFGAIQASFYRGKERDIMGAQIGIKQIQANYPNFDDNRYGMKEKFEDLKRKMDIMGGSK